MISFDSLHASFRSQPSERYEYIIGEGHDVTMRIYECCLVLLLFHVHDRHEQWWFRVNSPMKVKNLSETIFHYIVQYSIIGLLRLQIVYKST